MDGLASNKETDVASLIEYRSWLVFCPITHHQQHAINSFAIFIDIGNAFLHTHQGIAMVDEEDEGVPQHGKCNQICHSSFRLKATTHCALAEG